MDTQKALCKCSWEPLEEKVFGDGDENCVHADKESVFTGSIKRKELWRGVLGMGAQLFDKRSLDPCRKSPLRKEKGMQELDLHK
jgi:hypothetical protein